MNFSLWFHDWGRDGVRDCLLVASCLLSMLQPWLFMNSHFVAVSAALSQSCAISRHQWEGHMRRSRQGEFAQSPVEGNSSLEMDGNAMNEHRKLRFCSTHTCMSRIHVWKWIFIFAPTLLSNWTSSSFVSSSLNQALFSTFDCVIASSFPSTSVFK